MQTEETQVIVVGVIIVMALLLIIICASLSKSPVTSQPQVVASSILVDNDPQMEEEVFRLVNESRIRGATCGGIYKQPVEPLQWNDQLATAAIGHSRDMADNNYFSHTSLDGRTFVNRIINAGYTGYRALGENIAAGYTNANDVMNGWMNSPGHCNNIMNPLFKDLGVGYAYNSGSNYKTYWTQDFGAKF